MSDKTKNRIDALENNPKKKRLIFAFLIVLLSAMFISGIALGLVDLLDNEGKHELKEVTLLTAREPQNAEEAIEQLEELLNSAVNGDAENRVRLNVSTSLSIDNDSIVESESDEIFDDILKYIKDGILSKTNEFTYSYNSRFDEEFASALITPSFTADNIESFKWDAYKDGNGNVQPGRESTRILSIVFPDEAFPTEHDMLYKNFNLENAQDTFIKMRECCKDILSVTKSSISCRDFEIRAEFDAIENKIIAIDYKRNYEITLTVLFAGELEDLGEREISFKLSSNEKYTFTYAGLRLSQTVLWLEKGETIRLEAITTADEIYFAEWSTSDGDTVSVDSEGYVKGLRLSENPVTVTAQFTYLGNTYKQDCTVYVRKPLDKIKLTENELSMQIGETHSLSVEFSPKSANVKTIIWISEDESIVTVDENGTVTALSPGEADIIAVALDGTHKSICTVTVKDGGDIG